MFMHPPIKEAELLESIEKLQQLFTAEEVSAWQRMRAITMRDIKKYREDDAQDSLDIFIVKSGDSNTRDHNCDIHFTVISAAIKQATTVNAHPVTLAGMVTAIPNVLKELSDDITLFLKNDANEGRKKSYQQALTYLQKIDVCVAALKNKPDVSSASSSPLV